MRKVAASVTYNSEDQPFISARKTVCTNVPFADLAFISARNERSDTFDIYLVDTKLGKTTSWTDQLVGVRTGITGGLFLDAVPLPDIDTRRLGVAGQGPSILQYCFDLDRLYLAAMVSGCLRGLCDLAMMNIQERAEDDSAFSQHQYIQEKFYRVYACAEKIDGLISLIVNDLPENLGPGSLKKHRNTLSVLKELLCSEAYEAAFGVFELCGFLAFKGDHLVQKILRDLMAFKFLGGTKELQKNMLFQDCFRSTGIRV